MSIADLRKELEDIRASARAGDLAGVAEKAEHALATLDRARLVTTTEATALLGIRSVNTLKLLVRQSGLPYERHGNRMMIPIATLESLRASPALAGIHASDAAHDAMEPLGTPTGLTHQQLRDMAATRPGALPWRASSHRPSASSG